MSDCIFCDIVAGKIPCYKIREDENFIAFLDIFPNCKGQTLVIPKKHYDSDLFVMPDEVYSSYLLATKKVVALLKEKLKVQRVGMIMEGMGVNHVHMKLYPMHGLWKEWEQTLSGEPEYFEQYPWFLVSKMWPQADAQVLEKVREEISTWQTDAQK